MVIECPKCGISIPDGICEKFFSGEDPDPVCEDCNCTLREYFISKMEDEKWRERFRGIIPVEVKFSQRVKKGVKEKASKVRRGIGNKFNAAKEYFY